MDPQNTHEKTILTHKIPMREYFGLTNTHEKILDAPNTHKKKFWTHEILTRKNFGPTKYPQRHDGSMALNPRDPR